MPSLVCKETGEQKALECNGKKLMGGGTWLSEGYRGGQVVHQAHKYPLNARHGLVSQRGTSGG